MVSSTVSSSAQEFPVVGVRFPTRKLGNCLRVSAPGAVFCSFLIRKSLPYQETGSFLGGFLTCEVS
jgi:hypothetical protein